MATTIIDDLQWFSASKKAPDKQEIPTHDQLLAFPADETGNRLEDYGSYDPETDKLPDGRDSRTYAIDSPRGRANLIFIPDQYGWYVENGAGHKWRPENLEQLRDLLEEMDFQINRYGGLL